MKQIRQGKTGTAQSVIWLAALSWLILSPCFVGSAAQTATKAAALPACNAADPNQVRLEVSVSGMRSTAGNIQITIYPDDPSHFLDGAYKLARQELAVTLPVTRTCFVVAAPGYYAVALFHDENNSHHFDTTQIGLPAEAFGFSNNPTLYFGLPSLSRVRFAAHAGDNAVVIQLKRY